MKEGKCKLCRQTKPLIKKSHIISEFFYKEAGLYDEHHQFGVHFFKEGNYQRSSKRNLGEYESYILCQDCEKKFSEQESYARATLFSTNSVPVRKASQISYSSNDGLTTAHIKNINYQRFKLFLLSLLWRASISSRPFFNELSLDDLHEERPPGMLLSEDAGDEDEYLPMIFTSARDNSISKDFVSQPRTSTFSDHVIVTFPMADLFISFVVGLPKDRIPPHYRQVAIRKSNEMGMITLPNSYGREWLRGFVGL